MHSLPVTLFRNEWNWDSHSVPKSVLTRCPYCNQLNAMTFNPCTIDPHLQVLSGSLNCSHCEENSKVWLMEPDRGDRNKYSNWKQCWMLPAPKDESADLPVEVNDEAFRKDFREAVSILPHSPRASVMMSRYCLQKLLRIKAGVKKGKLHKEIQEVIDSNTLPGYLIPDIDAIRNLGNLGAHPSEDTNTGEIVEVEQDEAEWLIEVLRTLLDFYFVKPAQQQKRMNNLNEKLQATRKAPTPQNLEIEA
jgi:Domain of unknown function (DUF4145)